jgi:hypothetical protein
MVDPQCNSTEQTEHMRKPASTREILARLGYDAAEIEEMMASGAAGTSWSDKYLPE